MFENLVFNHQQIPSESTVDSVAKLKSALISVISDLKIVFVVKYTKSAITSQKRRKPQKNVHRNAQICTKMHKSAQICTTLHHFHQQIRFFR
jgi:hypothetical protein